MSKSGWLTSDVARVPVRKLYTVWSACLRRSPGSFQRPHSSQPPAQYIYMYTVLISTPHLLFSLLHHYVSLLHSFTLFSVEVFSFPLHLPLCPSSLHLICFLTLSVSGSCHFYQINSSCAYVIYVTNLHNIRHDG